MRYTVAEEAAAVLSGRHLVPALIPLDLILPDHIQVRLQEVAEEVAVAPLNRLLLVPRLIPLLRAPPLKAQ